MTATFETATCVDCAARVAAEHVRCLGCARVFASRRDEIEWAFLRSEDAVTAERLRTADNAHRARRRDAA